MDLIINAGMTSLMIGTEEWEKVYTMTREEKIARIMAFPNGLRGLYDNLCPDDFAAFLYYCMIGSHQLNLYLEVFFDSFSMDDSVIPHALYQMGFSHKLDQHLINPYNTPMMNYFKTLSCYQILPLEFTPVFPLLSHYPEIEHEIGRTMPYRGRPKKGKIYEPNSPTDKFFCHLGQANVCIRRERWYEAFAHSLTALDYSNHQYRTSALCQIAISSANISCCPEMTWKALGEAYCSIDFSGQQCEWMAALVRVLVAFGLFEEENHVFQFCHVMVSNNSSYQEDMMDQHLYGLTQQTENLLVIAVVTNHLESFTTYTFQELGKINCLVDDIINYSAHLKVGGAKNYYRGLAHLYRSMVQNQDHLRKEYVDKGVEFLQAVLKDMRRTDIRYVHSHWLADFLTETNYFMEEMTEAFREHTLMQWSKAGSDFWLRCTLLQIFNKTVPETFFVNAEAMSGEAKTSYFQATMMQGYRSSLLEYLRKFIKPVHKTPYGELRMFLDGIQKDEKFTTGYTDRSEAHSSRGYLHANKHTEQAFKIGEVISDNHQQV